MDIGTLKGFLDEASGRFLPLSEITIKGHDAADIGFTIPANELRAVIDLCQDMRLRYNVGPYVKDNKMVEARSAKTRERVTVYFD